MALSRIAPIAIAAALAAPAAAQPEPADRALEAQRDIVRSSVGADCAAAGPEEIVVCGRREQEEQERRFRVAPTPDSPGVEDRAGGAQRHAMAAYDQRCTPIGRAQQCNGGLDVLAIGFAIVRTIQAVRARRD